MLSVITPTQKTAPTDETGFFGRSWYLYFTAVTAAIGDFIENAVYGKPALSRIGRLTKVTDAGTIGEARILESEAVYAVKSAQADLATLAGTLGPSDAGKLVYVTDYAHTLEWSGSAWQWAPNELGSGMLVPFAAAPTGSGWHACDGSTVNYLKADGTLGSVTLPNTAASAAYLLAGSAYSSAIAAATAPTFAGNSVTPAGTLSAMGGPIGTTSINNPATGTPTAVASALHTHSTPTFTGSPLTPSGTVSLPGDPVAHFAAPLYFRQ